MSESVRGVIRLHFEGDDMHIFDINISFNDWSPERFKEALANHRLKTVEIRTTTVTETPEIVQRWTL